MFLSLNEMKKSLGLKCCCESVFTVKQVKSKHCSSHTCAWACPVGTLSKQTVRVVKHLGLHVEGSAQTLADMGRWQFLCPTYQSGPQRTRRGRKYELALTQSVVLSPDSCRTLSGLIGYLLKDFLGAAEYRLLLLPSRKFSLGNEKSNIIWLIIIIISNPVQTRVDSVNFYSNSE